MSTCFFIGHHEAPDTLLDKLSVEVERHITEYGVTEFVVGRYGRFDALAAKCVKAAKKRHPEVTLALLLPYHPYDRPTPTPHSALGSGRRISTNADDLNNILAKTVITWAIEEVTGKEIRRIHQVPLPMLGAEKDVYDVLIEDNDAAMGWIAETANPDVYLETVEAAQDKGKEPDETGDAPMASLGILRKRWLNTFSAAGISFSPQPRCDFLKLTQLFLRNHAFLWQKSLAIRSCRFNQRFLKKLTPSKGDRAAQQ